MNRFQYLALIILLSSCSGGDEGSPLHSFRVFTENGVTIAETTGGPKYTGELFQYEKLLEIKFDQEDENSLLVQPFSFVMDDDGNYYIADSGNHRIAVFDSDGQYIRSIGQHGEGPGDLIQPRSIYYWGNRLVIPGSPGNRTSIFHTDGSLIDVLTYPLGGYRLREIYKSDNGQLILVKDLQEQTPEHQLWGKSITLLDTAGDTLTTLKTPLYPMMENVMIEQTVFVRSTESYERRQYPYPAQINYSAPPIGRYLPTEEILITTGREPILQFYDMNGELTKEIRIDLPKVPVSPDEKDQLIDALDRLIEQAPENPDERSGRLPRESVERINKTLRFAEYKVFWSWVRYEEPGYLWLAQPGPQRLDYTINTVDEYRLLSPEGEYIGNTNWPAVYTGQVVRGHLLAIVIDQVTGEQIPTVFKLHTAISGLRYP